MLFFESTPPLDAKTANLQLVAIVLLIMYLGQRFADEMFLESPECLYSNTRSAKPDEDTSFNAPESLFPRKFGLNKPMSLTCDSFWSYLTFVKKGDLD